MEDFAVSWWLWIVLGIVLLAGEILTPGGFYIFFFGASAICVGLLKLLGFTQGFVFEGLLTRTVADAALGLVALSGPDPRDPLSFPFDDDPLGALERPVAGMRIAYSPDLGGFAVDPAVAGAGPRHKLRAGHDLHLLEGAQVALKVGVGGLPIVVGGPVGGVDKAVFQNDADAQGGRLLRWERGGGDGPARAPA